MICSVSYLSVEMLYCPFYPLQLIVVEESGQVFSNKLLSKLPLVLGKRLL